MFIAAVLPKDANHEAGRRIMARVAAGEWSAVHTSDYVVAETLNYVRARVPRRDVAEAVLRPVFGHARAPPAVTSVLRIHSQRFASALERYRAKLDAGLSFTDWTSLVAMSDERIEQVATFDVGFRGFADVIDG